MNPASENLGVVRPCCPGFVAACEKLALLVAAVALAGSLYLSLGMGLQACPLCIYERTFLMGVATVLGLSLFLPALRGSGLATWLALPLTVAGMGVAAFHVWLEQTQVLVCPYGFQGLGTAPQQSLGAYALLFLLLLGASLGFAGQGRFGRWLTGFVPTVALGALLAGAAIVSGPPLPPVTKTIAEATTLQAERTLASCVPVKADLRSPNE